MSSCIRTVMQTENIKRREEVRKTIWIIYFCPCGFCGGKSVTGTVVWVLRFLFSTLIPPVLHIYSYISQGTDNGPIGSRCFKRCWRFCVSEERNGLYWAATWAATLKNNESWPTLSRRCGNACLYLFCTHKE